MRPLLHLPLLKGVLRVPSLTKPESDPGSTPLGVGDWLTDKDTLCWLNQELLRC